MKFRNDLTQERLKEKLQYDPETGIFTWRQDHRNAKIGSIAGWPGGNGYIQIMVDGVSYLAHRLAWLYHYGEWPENELDHDNHVRSDNRICNLNKSSKAHNAKNCKRRSDNTTGITGVDWVESKKRWVVRIQSKGRRRSGGYFKLKKDAVSARKKLEKQYNFNPNHGR